MPLDNAYFIKDLDPSNPVGTIDKVSLLDDIIREVKGCIVNTFPDMDGEVKYSTDELNDMRDNLVLEDDEWDFKGNYITNVSSVKDALNAGDDDKEEEPLGSDVVYNRADNDKRYLRAAKNFEDVVDKSAAFDNLFKEVDYTSEGIKSFRTVINNLVYPVGSLYYNVQSDQNPSEYLGVGTWVKYAEGRAIVGTGELNDGHDTKTFKAGEVFGSYSAELKEEHLPPHSHPHNLVFGGGSDGNGGRRAISVDVGRNDAHEYQGSADVGMSTGQNKRHDNVQPSISVHIWRRTE